MDSHSFVNPAFQVLAAFVIFLTGFMALFLFTLVCAAVVWILYRCTNRVAEVARTAITKGRLGRQAIAFLQGP
jgi:hypothetical protein